MQHVLDVVRDKLSAANLLGFGLLWATVLASVVISYRNSGLPRTWSGFWRHAFPPEVLKHPSARADILFFLSRKLLNPFLVVPMAMSAAGIGALVNAGLRAVLPFHAAAPDQPLGPVMVWVFTITMFLTYDLGYYIYHYAQHKVPLFWELHKVHHSAEVMVGVTKDRIHPIDDVMNHVWDGLFAGVVYGVWLFFAYDPVEVAIFGLNVYALRGILMLDFTRHTHLKVTYSERLNRVLISPHYHQLHHSSAEEHWDKNFGLVFSVWDRLFGTLAHPKPNEDFTYGLPDEEHRQYRSWLRLYYVPVVRMFRMVFGRRRVSQATPSSSTSHDLAA